MESKSLTINAQSTYSTRILKRCMYNASFIHTSFFFNLYRSNQQTTKVELRPEVMTQPPWPPAEVVILSVRASAVGMAEAASTRIRMSLRFQEQSGFLPRLLANPLRNLLFASGSCVVPSSIPRESC